VREREREREREKGQRQTYTLRPIKMHSPLLYPSTSASFSPPTNGAEKKEAHE